MRLGIPITGFVAVMFALAAAACGVDEEATNRGTEGLTAEQQGSDLFGAEPSAPAEGTGQPQSSDREDDPGADIVFDMEREYRPGDPVEISIQNKSNVTYYYNSYYPACYNLKFFDDSDERRPYPDASLPQEHLMLPGQFIVPEGTHCDLVFEESLAPGQTVELLIWDQEVCIKDSWGCDESLPVQPGRYRIEGEFSSTRGVISPGPDTPESATTTTEWTFVISEAADGPADAPAASDDVEITCSPAPMPSQEEIDAKLAEIKEPVAREAYLRALNRGIGEIVPGFGGIFVDNDNNNIAYIYLLDPEDEDLVAEATEILYERTGREFQEVRPLQGQYSYSQLKEWVDCWDSRQPRLSTTTMSGISEGTNRISIGVASEADVVQAERELEALGIPLEAAEIEVRELPVLGGRWGRG